MRKIFWLETAEDARQAHIESLARFSLTAALSALDEVMSQMELLKQFPQMGRLGRVQGTRELLIQGTKFIVVYRIFNDQIQVLNFLNSSLQWP